MVDAFFTWFNSLNPAQTGPFSAWLAAVVAGVALVYAGVNSRRTSKTLKNQAAALAIQQRQFQIFEEDRISDQARKVTFEKLATPHYVVRNDSDFPILRVMLTTDARTVYYKAFVSRDHIPPHSTLDMSWNADEVPVVVFMDSAGREWVRTTRGHPIPYDVFLARNAGEKCQIESDSPPVGDS